MGGDPGGEMVYGVNPNLGDDLDVGPDWINAPLGVLRPERAGAGFPAEMSKPILDFSRILAHRPAYRSTPLQECYEFGSNWIVSETLWTTLSSVDPTGFQAVPAEVRMWDGSIGPSYWLATLTRISDCFNEQRSRENGVRISENGTPTIGITAPSIFNVAALGDAMFFRPTQHKLTCLCTERARASLLDAGHARFHFRAIGRLV